MHRSSRKANGSSRAEQEVIQYDKTPKYMDAVMRDYQLDGLNWLIRTYENGINGILGDEMGLGKNKKIFIL